MDIFKRTNILREKKIEEAETGMAPTTPATPKVPNGPKFGKAFTPEEKKLQAKKLADMLRSRE